MFVALNLDSSERRMLCARGFSCKDIDGRVGCYISAVQKSNFKVIFINQSRCQCHAWAAIHSACQDVSVIPGNIERVVHFAITALLVLEQQV